MHEKKISCKYFCRSGVIVIGIIRGLVMLDAGCAGLCEAGCPTTNHRKTTEENLNPTSEKPETVPEKLQTW